MIDSKYPVVPGLMQNALEWIRRAIPIIQDLQRGHLNIRGQVTLRANEATTDIVLSQNFISDTSAVFFTPRTANAAQEINQFYVSNIDVATSTITITHNNDAQTDKTYDFIVIG